MKPKWIVWYTVSVAAAATAVEIPFPLDRVFCCAMDLSLSKLFYYSLRYYYTVEAIHAQAKLGCTFGLTQTLLQSIISIKLALQLQCTHAHTYVRTYVRMWLLVSMFVHIFNFRKRNLRLCVLCSNKEDMNCARWNIAYNPITFPICNKTELGFFRGQIHVLFYQYAKGFRTKNWSGENSSAIF